MSTSRIAAPEASRSLITGNSNQLSVLPAGPLLVQAAFTGLQYGTGGGGGGDDHHYHVVPLPPSRRRVHGAATRRRVQSDTGEERVVENGAGTGSTGGRVGEADSAEERESKRQGGNR